MPGRQKISSEYLDQIEFSQTGACCIRKDSRLGGGAVLASRDSVPMYFTYSPGLTDKSSKTYPEVL